MNPSLQRVCVVGTGSFLPNDPVPNDRLDDVLGHLPDAPPRVQSFIKNMGPRMFSGGGVEQRHFAIDPETQPADAHGRSAGRGGRPPGPGVRQPQTGGHRPAAAGLLELRLQHATDLALLQERLGIPKCAEMEIHSNCSGVGKAMQIAYDALRLGRYRTA